MMSIKHHYRRLSCWFMFDRHAFACVKDATEDECAEKLLRLFNEDQWGGIAGKWEHCEQLPSFSVRNTDPDRETKLRQYVADIYAGRDVATPASTY